MIIRSKKNKNRALIVAAFLLILCANYYFLFNKNELNEHVMALPPYPPSTVVLDVEWDYSSLKREASGSDLWPTTWSNDGFIYTAWGDGGGFHGTNAIGRVNLGVGRIEGIPEMLSAVNLWGGYNATSAASFVGKPTGLVSINGCLYMGVVEQNKWLRWKIGRSIDHGHSWEFNGEPFEKNWDFAEPDGAFSDTSFLNFGKDYSGSRDEYVYAYSQDNRAAKDRYSIAMFRVKKDKLLNRNAYEYFAGLDAYKNPQWVSNIKHRKSVFRDPNGVGWGVRVVYNPGIKRYLLTTWHKLDGSWGIFEAPEPWGPWATIAYYKHWIDNTPKFGFDFPRKWMSADGRTMWMVFSGTGIYDSINLIKASLILKNTSDRNMAN